MTGRLDWDKAGRDRRRKPHAPKPVRTGTTKPPSAKQLAYLRALAERTSRTFATPRTSHEASTQIGLLLAARRS